MNEHIQILIGPQKIQKILIKINSFFEVSTTYCPIMHIIHLQCQKI
jgi:hypothetical protein